MTMTLTMVRAVAALVLLGQVAQAPPPLRVDDLTSAKALYAAAAYEEALARLARIPPDAPAADEADVYRALCAIALERQGEAEGALERILRRTPAYVLDEPSVSPRLVTLWTDVRTRVLRAHAMTLYSLARRRFDAGQHERAAADFRDVLAVIAGLPGAQADLSELRTLAEGFLKLADSMPRTTATVQTVVPEPARAPAADGPRLYTARDADVIAPVEVARPVPSWDPPAGTPRGLYQGLIEVVINESGRVEAASIRRSIALEYDEQLLEAAARWRFQPALRNGAPVKFVRAFEVILHTR